MNIGGTVSEVSRRLYPMLAGRPTEGEGRPALPTALYYPARDGIDGSIIYLPLISRLERLTLGTECPRCGAFRWLCYSGTGLPASNPHDERIARAYLLTGL